nr:MAG TPA: hypothetical protein [Bacteriophage sp.]
MVFTDNVTDTAGKADHSRNTDRKIDKNSTHEKPSFVLSI